MINEIRQYLDKLPPRDRLALLVLVAFLLVFVLGAVAFSLHKAADKAEQQAQQERQTLAWLRSLAPQFSGNSVASNGAPVLDVVSGGAASQGITLQRFEPDGDKVRVWLEGADFAKVANWMNVLLRQGVRPLEAHFEQNDKGLNVRLVFGR